MLIVHHVKYFSEKQKTELFLRVISKKYKVSNYRSTDRPETILSD